jgi:hypothetical protein
MKAYFPWVPILFLFFSSNAQLARIQAAPNGRYLQYANGQPFFWLGDTGWELFHRLTIEEIAQYLDNRSKKGFNVLQAVALAEFDGLRKPNRYGQLPLHNMDPRTPNEQYFSLVDTTIEMAASRNMYIGLLPTWGDKVARMWGLGPAVFDSVNAYDYGLWLGKRYAANTNIIWILGGDRPPVSDSADWRPVWRSMARGILQGTNGKAFITYHISGGQSTSRYLQQEPWLQMNMFQSGHGSGHDVPVWDWVRRDRAQQPAKPVIDAEPNYEDHPVNPWPRWDSTSGYFRDYDVRKQCYRSVFSGAAGVTYGHHAVWQFWSAREEKINHADRMWTDAIDRPGAWQVGYLRKLIESRPFNNRIPDQSLIVAGQGTAGDYSTAFRDSNNRYLMLYMPVGKNIAVNVAVLKTDTVLVRWFNPRTGSWVDIGPKSTAPVMSFTPPSLGTGNDWVLVLDHPRAGYRLQVP